jgi:EF-hand domain-containing protein 1
MYFLEDHTLMISEPREENSGVPQGKFLKRRQILREDGSGLALLPTDFRVGTDVSILGRQIRICDCDKYTREFFEFQGKPQPQAEAIPLDSFAQALIKKPVFRDSEMKEFMEKSLGGGRVPSEKQFLDNDRKVLRFFTRYDEVPFIIHYYLADDTCEIREVHHPNDGRDNFALLLKRRKIPYSFSVSQPGLGFLGDNYLTYNQIFPDKTIDAFGRNFQITGVDDFTQNFYQAKLGRSFKIGEIEYPRPRSPTVRQIPPHNGFGDEVDSLGFVYRLLPEKPKRDFFKYVDNDKTVLRYIASFNTRVPEDIDRKFIISFFLADDSISIFEPA